MLAGTTRSAVSRRRVLVEIVRATLLAPLVSLAACERIQTGQPVTTYSRVSPSTTAIAPAPRTAAPAAAGGGPKGKQAPIIYWSMFGLQEADLANKQTERFNKEHHANAIFVSIGWGAVAKKVETAIAGGVPPDLVSLWSQAYSWGPRGLLQPVDAYAARDKWTGQGWSPAAWQSLHAEGHLWGTLQSLNVWALYINEGPYRAAGLDPDKPPTTTRELDQVAATLTKYDAGGNLTQLGFVPWAGGPGLWHWGYAFGGEFYDEKTDKILAATDPRILEALTWMVSYAKRYDISKVDKFMAQSQHGFQSAGGMWYLGERVMKIDGSWLRSWVPRYAKGLAYEIVKTPTAHGLKPTSLIEPAAMFNIPTGAKNPEGAWELAKAFASKQDAIEYGNLVGDVPPFADAANAPAFLTALPGAKVFVELSETGGRTWPRMPVLDIYQQQIGALVNDAIHMKVEPKAGLANVARIVQSKLDAFRAQWKRGDAA